MLAKRDLTFTIFVLSAILLLSLLLHFAVSRNQYAEAAPLTAKAVAELDPRLQIAALVKVPPRTAAEKSLQTPAKPVAVAAAAAAPSSSEVTLPYITTAYYLNVREKPSNKARILRVVEKGTTLSVLKGTENGWLQLDDGGFVHGGYAEPAKAGVAAAAIEAVLKPKVPASEPSKPTSVVYSDSGLTQAHIEEILEGTALADQQLEEAILEIEDKYGINAYFTIAVMKLESGNGKSRLAKTKNNLFGLNATGNGNHKAFSFETKADSVRKFGQLISKSYVGKGYTTVEKVARKYCPANSKWPKLVKSIMYSDHNKI
ncbi:SH3 domain-containing protein [Cohnella sp. CFH 77786]|uniref:glucosaminidase domain-containing protein n=1 Tax=Cohnella sp. CFH 77786 TaxID=2662265 RepID=UPI001C60AD50|nr:glucosaminidase domain-containing protein [Cohnella sp. CFH 77786]MBW5446346.1 SH3 domain-containing protein [Cohnella sp. CFH 77786]